MDSIEKLIERGRKEGLQKGRQEGLQTGRREGKRTTLLQLLELKFGPLSENHRARAEEASLEDLDRYIERVLTADSTDAVFGE